jgi:hypothetical protein
VNGDQTIDQAKQAHVINVRLANTARALLYQYVEPEDKVSVGLVSPQSLTVEGNDHARRLVFSVECYVYPQQGRALRIQGELTSDGWVPRGPLPPVGRMCAELVPTHNDDSEAELAYIFTLLKAQTSHRYLTQPIHLRRPCSSRWGAGWRPGLGLIHPRRQ